ncbi:MAG: AbrB/MazE/SpoVT family DNA-binding domain-containing protein [Methanomicrobiales archaeon]|nr:AbrB/MazE/SpoVT family DNA-binding domain-containing protein [Methanomicrobiales archaeon]
MTDEPACAPCAPGSACRIEAVVAVDERGQVLLPKDLRERADIRPGDRLTIVSWERDGTVCCLTLMKADALAGAIRTAIEPIFTQVKEHGAG